LRAAARKPFSSNTKAIDARIENLQRFGKAPPEVGAQIMPVGAENKIMRGVIRSGSEVLMGSAGPCGGPRNSRGSR
jgi:hypothetical protein